jgi:uncharacterized protein (TIGR03437 family)
MKKVFVLCGLACALITPTVLAQSPQISAIVSSASYSPLNLTIHGLASIFGSGLSDAVYEASALPWPTKLGKTSVFSCVGANCTALPLLYVGPGLVNFLLPDSPYAVQLYVTVDSATVPIASAKGTLVLEQYNPDIFWLGYDCLIDPRVVNRDMNCGLGTPVSSTQAQALRGTITDLQGNLLLSSNPATPGKYYTIWLTGLGLNAGPAPPIQFGNQLVIILQNVPVYGYPGPTYFMLAPSYVGESPWPGLYQINFQLPLSLVTGNSTGYPPAWPCGNYDWELDFGFSPQFDGTNLQIPVSVRIGDVPCN